MPTTAATETVKGHKARSSTAAATAVRSATQHQPALSQRHRTTEQALACKALCSQVSELLYAASDADQDCAHSCNAQRLLSIAGSSADLAAMCEWRQPSPEDPIYDVAALMSAASRVPGDVMGPARSELLSQAWDLLLQLTESDRREDIDDSHFANQPTATAQAERGTSQALLNGYNARQITTVQEEIATRAASLGEYARKLRDELDAPQLDALYWPLNGVADMADMIGLLADAVTGGAIKGDATAWLIGPIFANEGKAVQP